MKYFLNASFVLASLASSVTFASTITLPNGGSINIGGDTVVCGADGGNNTSNSYCECRNIRVESDGGSSCWETVYYAAVKVISFNGEERTQRLSSTEYSSRGGCPGYPAISTPDQCIAEASNSPLCR